MLKACVLHAGAARLLFLPPRALRSPSVSHSFSSTVHVSRDRRHLDFPIQPRRLNYFLDHDPPAIESDEIRHDELQPETLSSARPIERGIQSWGVAGPRDEAANKVQIEIKGQVTNPKERIYHKMDALARAPQEFHAKIHPVILENLINMTELRGMPLYDSTFNAVLSGRNLFIQVPGTPRWLQYLLPLAHRILEHGAWKPRRVPEPEVWRPRPEPPWGPRAAWAERPSEVLVICATLDDAKDAELWGTHLLQLQADGLRISALEMPMDWGPRKHMIQPCNVLMSTPERFLQRLAIGPVRANLLKMLEDVKTIVVDGRGKFMRRPEFFKMLSAVMDDVPLQQVTQRIVVSDEHDPDLVRHLERIVLSSDYEFHHDPNLDEIQALRKQLRPKWMEERIKKRQERREWLKSPRIRVPWEWPNSMRTS